MITNYVEDIKLPMGYLLDIGEKINSFFFVRKNLTRMYDFVQMNEQSYEISLYVFMLCV